MTFESEIQAVIDAAREAGLKDYTRNDAAKALLQEQEHQSNKDEWNNTNS